MTTVSGGEYAPVLFLDTNVLHYVHLYLDLARNHNVWPFCGDPADGRNAVTEVQGTKNYRDCVAKGCKLLRYLYTRHEANVDTTVMYSPITQLECVSGYLRAKAIVNAAKLSVPDRWWGRFGQKDVSEHLRPEDYNDMRARVYGLADEISSLEIGILQTQWKYMPEIWRLAEVVLSRVYLDMQDGFIYASAVFYEAEELITDDSYFKGVTNKIANLPQDEQERDFFARVRAELVSEITRFRPIEPSELTPPVAHQIKDLNTVDEE